MQRRQFCRMMAATALGVASLPPAAAAAIGDDLGSGLPVVCAPPMTIDPNVPYSAVIKTSLGR